MSLKKFLGSFLLLFIVFVGFSQNPLINTHFTADPTARVFDGKLYVYPSHDIPCEKGQGYIGFCMADYHVYSTESLTEWNDHSVVLRQTDVPWVNALSYSMWAPDCIKKGDLYYFYFPAISSETPGQRRIGVATAKTPFGPFKPQDSFIKNVKGIDPNPFIDQDGQAYLYWGGGEELFVAKLKNNLFELATEPQVIQKLPPKFKEGAFVFEKEGDYYLTFPHVLNKTERLVYAVGKDPMGPFTYKGVLMDESKTGCWTNHHSIVNFKEQWYLFYHHNDYSPNFDKNRSIKADSLFFNADGTIQKVIPTNRGVGKSLATNKIEIDRFSDKSDKSDKKTTISFLDKKNKQLGWQTNFQQKGAWIRYNQVNFVDLSINTINVKVKNSNDAEMEVRLDSLSGPLVTTITLPKYESWKTVPFKIENTPQGSRDLFVILKKGSGVAVDWVQFK